MHFASNYSTNGRLHLLLIRWHMILVDLVPVEVLNSHAGLVFEVLCILSVAYLSNTIYQMQEKIKKICTYENRINLITKWGQPIESTEIGR